MPVVGDISIKILNVVSAKNFPITSVLNVFAL